MRFPVPASLAASVFALLCATPASALMQVTLTETDFGVAASFSGSLDLTGLDTLTDLDPPPVSMGFLAPVVPALGAVSASGFDAYAFQNAPGEAWQAFGLGAEPASSSEVSGDQFYFTANIESAGDVVIIVPEGYSSGETLFGAFLFSGATLALVGATPGTYSYALPNDSIELTVSAAAVPLPAAAPLLAAGLGGLALFAGRRRQG